MRNLIFKPQSGAQSDPLDLLDRRAVMVGGASGIAGMAASMIAGEGMALAQTNTDEATKPFSKSYVLELARSLSVKPYQDSNNQLPASLPKLTYDEYRDIRFRQERAVWHGQNRNSEMQLFATGYLANKPVDIWIAQGGTARRLKANKKDFSLGPLVSAKDKNAPHGLSGFRIHGPINRDDYLDEYAVFQGASYFRAVARDQAYGLSARGLALNTARPEGEEFPVFRSFWIETPRKGADNVIVHALLDSPSITGAYRFDIRPGIETTMQVSATLFARKTLEHVGLAPLTSMYLFGSASRRINGDFRPAVHDSEGLAMFNGRSERLWRPLTNPKTLQASVFQDNNPKGFGLLQRSRDFRTYQDLEADYERRPSLWIEPMENWGQGHVELIEIPSKEEIHDNIVAFWKPKAPLRPGKPYKFSYRMRWTQTSPKIDATATIATTRVGKGSKPGLTRFVVDVVGAQVGDMPKIPAAKLSSPHAKPLGTVVVQKNPNIGGLRASFDIPTANLDLADLRLDLIANDRRISETWLYRWTRS